MIARLLVIVCLAWFPLSPVFSQIISYTEPERDDSRNMEFEVIGKVGGNVLVYKNVRNRYAISVYDMEMKLKERVKLDFLPDRIINADFIQYADFCYFFYTHQKRDIVFSMMARIGGDGKIIGEPREMDTTRIGMAANNRIYTLVNSEDRQKILIFKINTRNEKNFIFTTLLYDKDLQLLRKSRMNMPMEERNDFFTDFALDNEGDMVFGKFIRNGGNDYIQKVLMVTKPALGDSMQVRDLGINNRYLDDVKLKIDNLNRKYLVNAFYYKARRGNIEGLYTAVWDKALGRKAFDTATTFNDELRIRARGNDASLKTAFNDFYIRHVIPRKDGGFLVCGEALYTTNRGNNAFSRQDFLWGSPFASPLDYYYSPFSYYNYYAYGWAPPWATSPWARGQQVRYNAENVIILSFNKVGQLEWSNVVTKSQFDDDSDALISYQLINTGGQLHFLFNQSERRNLLLNDQSLSADGQVTRNPTLKNLDKGYDFLPRYGKQIGSRQIVMPCYYRNYLCFAKIDF